MTAHDHHIFKDRFDAGESTHDILDSSKGVDWRRIFAQYPRSFEFVAEGAREALQKTLRRAVSRSKHVWAGLFTDDALAESSHWPRTPTIDFAASIKTLPVNTLELLRPEIAYEFACTYDHPYDMEDPDLVNKLSDELLPREVVDLLDKPARMWLGLRRLSEMKAYSERNTIRRLAIEDFVMRLVEDSPNLWAESLHIILTHVDEIGDLVEAITFSLAQKSEDVIAALKFIGDKSDSIPLREQARGMLLLVEGVDRPQTETIDRLVDQLSRWANSGILFPHPLSPLSATWLSSNDAEKSLRSGMSLGLTEFKSDFNSQGAKNERALVQSLLTELSFPFRKDRPVVRVIGRRLARLEPMITVKHRTLVESEETVYGPDIAFIMRTKLHASMKLEIAEFVQVKKPNRRGEGWTDSWKIDVKQLNDLLNTSSSAVYWLINRDGTILTVPAKLIKAWTPLTAGKSFTIGFNKVRSAAIPVDQFLAELLVGAWVGNGQPIAMKIARGEEPRLVPRELVEVSVSTTSENNG